MEKLEAASGTADRSRPGHLLNAISSCASSRCYGRGTLIYDVGDPTDSWYRVAAGIAARCADLSDGRRQIVELLLPGDFFGFSAHAEHPYAVEAVADETTIVRYPRRSVEALVQSNPKLEGDLRRLAFDAIGRLDDRVVTVGCMNAVERVGAFLLEMAERAPDEGLDQVALPLSRYQIADYLGLSMETVSRSFGELKKKEAISLFGPHRVKLLNRTLLRPE